METERKSFPMGLIFSSTQIALSGNNPKDAAKKLLLIEPETRAMTLAYIFGFFLENLLPEEATDGAEKLGRHAEAILDEMPDDEQTATITAMIAEGDVEMILYMLKGNAGGFSTVGKHLTEKMLEELFRTDAELNRARVAKEEELQAGVTMESESDALKRMRTLHLVTTLLETPTPLLLRFFYYNPVGVEAFGLIQTMANEGHEDASHLARTLKLYREEQGDGDETELEE